MLVNNNRRVWDEHRKKPNGGDSGCQSLKEARNKVSQTEYLVSQKAPLRGGHWAGKVTTSVTVTSINETYVKYVTCLVCSNYMGRKFSSDLAIQKSSQPAKQATYEVLTLVNLIVSIVRITTSFA